KYTQVRVEGAVATSGENPGKCGSPTDLGSSAGATINVLHANLMYVQNVPAEATHHRKVSGRGDPHSGLTRTDDSDSVPLYDRWGRFLGYQTTKYGEKWTFQTNVVQPGHSSPDRYISHPLANEKRPAYSSAANPAYGCRNGDLYVSGTVGGRMTVAAENYVYVQGDILYLDPSRDVLGVVGNNAIFVWNPMPTSGSTPILNSDKDRVIQAALMSVD